ncbi:MAG TPA: hypothetical protein VGR73_23565 [Bryobacteraceae bacterium]|nr:hypothetical protein [Bryobacteraceae bacterium]
MPRRAVIRTRTTFVGVTALARETGLTQSYVSKLLARGWTPDGIRQWAEWVGYKRQLRATLTARRERLGRRR